eukprot:jgi/Psemu1/2813/gm1.2813_g
MIQAYVTRSRRNLMLLSRKCCYAYGEEQHIKRDCPALKNCSHCGRKGHTEATCWNKHPEKKPKWLKAKNNPEMLTVVYKLRGLSLETALLNAAIPNMIKPMTPRQAALTAYSRTNLLFSVTLWIAGTGATCHVSNNNAGSTPLKNANEQLKSAKLHSLDASGNKMLAIELINVRGIDHSSNDKAIQINMTDCQYEGSKFNLCSITKLTNNGWTMVGNKIRIYLRKRDKELHLDIPICTHKDTTTFIRPRNSKTLGLEAAQGKTDLRPGKASEDLRLGDFEQNFCVKLKKLKVLGQSAKQFRGDNAGESQSFEKALTRKYWKFNVCFECTAKTTQRNS